MEQTTVTTCQICGRVIKAKNGKIAHHGYTRPDYGWQTASCRGARHLPYQVSNDAIQPEIDNTVDYVARHEATLTEWLTNPPAVIAYIERNGRSHQQYEVSRPDGFDPANPFLSGEHPKKYARRFERMISELQSEISGAKRHIEYLQKRLADWQAPAAK